MPKKSHPTLAEVKNAFEAWRQSGRTRTTPMALRAQAVKLLAEYSHREVIKALGIDHRRLSRWRRELSASERLLVAEAFVELPATELEQRAPLGPLPPLTLMRQGSDGKAVSLSGQLSEAQWRWALELLQASVS